MSDYKIYTYWRSSCSARLLVALNLKGISYEQIPVNLLKEEHISATHKGLNPSGTVPLLLKGNGNQDTLKIGQSVAALEYLEERHPEQPLIPSTSDPAGRAVVRQLTNIIACDVQPVTNLRIMLRVRALGGNAEEWNKELTFDGLQAYESVAKPYAGKYSYGDSVTIADLCLLPGAWNAARFGVDLGQFPTVQRVVENLEKLPAVEKASYFNQPDTPAEWRGKTSF